MSRRPLARALCLVASALALTACRVDVTVDVAMRENGSGQVSVVLVADAAVVSAAPGLADDLRTTDLAAAGWRLIGPSSTTAGGLTATLVHDFDTPEQATALLSTLNGPAGPLQAINLQRSATDDAITYTASGTGRLDGGLAAFADLDLVGAVGGTPYAEQIAAAGLAPTDAVGVVLQVRLPGAVAETTATTADASTAAPATSFVPLGQLDDASTSTTADATAATGGTGDTDADAEVAIIGGETLVFPLALDGTDTDIRARTVRSLERGGGWGLLATALLVLLVVWVIVSIVGVVAVARRQRRRDRTAQRVGARVYQRQLDDTHP